jgi:hypothetical protein
VHEVLPQAEEARQALSRGLRGGGAGR